MPHNNPIATLQAESLRLAARVTDAQLARDRGHETLRAELAKLESPAWVDRALVRAALRRIANDSGIRKA